MGKKSIEERIDAFGESCKEKLREKMGALMTVEGPNAITLDGIEGLCGKANEEAKELISDFFDDVVNDNLQNELLRKKKLN
jgi:hypothetical protein